MRYGGVGKGRSRFGNFVKSYAGWRVRHDHKNVSPLRAKRSGRGVVDAGADACLDVGIYLIVRQKGVIIGKVGGIKARGSGGRKGRP